MLPRFVRRGNPGGDSGPTLFYSARWPQMGVLEWAPRLFQATTLKQPDSKTHCLDYPRTTLRLWRRVRLRPGGEAGGGRIFVPPEKVAPIRRSSEIRPASSCDLLREGREDRASRRRRRRPLASAPRAPQRRSPGCASHRAAPDREEITLSARRLFGNRFFTSELPKDFGLQSIFRHYPRPTESLPKSRGAPSGASKPS